MRRTLPTRFRAIVSRQLCQVKGSVALAALCMCGSIVADLLAPWPLKIIVDHLLLSKPLPASLAMLGELIAGDKLVAVFVVSLSILVLAAINGVLNYFQHFLMSRIGYQMVYTLRRELFTHLQRLSLAYHNRARSGELLTKVAGDTTTLKDTFADSALTFAAQVLTIIGMIGIMFALNRQLSLIVVLTLPLLGSTLFYLYRKIKASARRQRKKEGEVASRISEILSSIALVQAFGRERYERERFETESAQTLSESIRTARMEAAATRTMEIVSALGVWAVVLVGAYQALNGRLLLGELLIFITYVNSIYKPIRSLAKLSSKFSKAAVSAERISEILAIEPDIHDAPGAVGASELHGNISFEHVSFDYGDGTPILHDLSFTVPAGRKVALVGASGAGKSTISSLILRFYDPCAGRIMIDGVDLRAYQRESLRQQIGIMLQDSILFGASIGENIAYGKPDATREEIEQAARQAHAHDFISALPDGYDTILGEGGSTISGGQRQRICLARAIIKRPALLILDEPTSAVDAESSALIRAAIECVQHGKTTLVIAHNFGFIEHFDHILVMHGGRIVEQGKHAELLACRGYYYDLFQLQQADRSLPQPDFARVQPANSQALTSRAAAPVPAALPDLAAADTQARLTGAGGVTHVATPGAATAPAAAAGRPAAPAQHGATPPANQLYLARAGVLLAVLVCSAVLGFGPARPFGQRFTGRVPMAFLAGADPSTSAGEQRPATPPAGRAAASVAPAPSPTAVTQLPTAAAVVGAPVTLAMRPTATIAAPPTATPTNVEYNAASVVVPTAPAVTPVPATPVPAAPRPVGVPRPTVALQAAAPPMPTEAPTPTAVSQPTAAPEPEPPPPTTPPEPTVTPAPPSAPAPSDAPPEPSDDHGEDNSGPGNGGDDDNSGPGNGDDGDRSGSGGDGDHAGSDQHGGDDNK